MVKPNKSAPTTCDECTISSDAWNNCDYVVTDTGWKSDSVPGHMCPFVKLDQARRALADLVYCIDKGVENEHFKRIEESPSLPSVLRTGRQIVAEAYP